MKPGCPTAARPRRAHSLSGPEDLSQDRIVSQPTTPFPAEPDSLSTARSPGDRRGWQLKAPSPIDRRPIEREGPGPARTPSGSSGRRRAFGIRASAPAKVSIRLQRPRDYPTKPQPGRVVLGRETSEHPLSHDVDLPVAIPGQRCQLAGFLGLRAGLGSEGGPDRPRPAVGPRSRVWMASLNAAIRRSYFAIRRARSASRAARARRHARS